MPLCVAVLVLYDMKTRKKEHYIQVTSNRNSHEISGSQNGEHKDSWNVTLWSFDRHWCLRGDCYLHIQDGRSWAWKKWVPQQYRYLSTKLHFLTSQKNTMLKIPTEKSSPVGSILRTIAHDLQLISFKFSLILLYNLHPALPTYFQHWSLCIISWEKPTSEPSLISVSKLVNSLIISQKTLNTQQFFSISQQQIYT